MCVNKEEILQLLKTKNAKLTPQRKKVLDLIEKAGAHFSPESLYSLAKKENCEVSLASIYRTIKLLLNNGILEEHDFLKTYKFYEVIIGREHHDHFVCTKCGRVEEFVSKEIEELQNSIARSYGFTIEFHTHKIYGVCKECNAKVKEGQQQE